MGVRRWRGNLQGSCQVGPGCKVRARSGRDARFVPVGGARSGRAGGMDFVGARFVPGGGSIGGVGPGGVGSKRYRPETTFNLPALTCRTLKSIQVQTQTTFNLL
jgi:hypothetical protein